MGKKYTTDEIEVGGHTLNASMMGSLNTVVTNSSNYMTTLPSHTHDYVRDDGTSFNGTYPMVVRVGNDSIYSHSGITFTGSSSQLLVGGSIKTPIVYDNNNTSYYVNPASTSNFNVINATGGTSTEWNTAYDWGDYSTGVSRGFLHGKLFSTSGDADTYTQFGIYRNYGSNGPASNHTTILHVSEVSGNYGYQLAGSTLANDDGLYFRNFASAATKAGATWYQVASRPWVTSYLGSYLTTSGKAADSNLLDGIDSTSFLRSDADDAFSGTLTGSAQRMMAPNDYGKGVYGKYNSSRFQHVWGMGQSWHMASNGDDLGNFYGIAYTHTNVGTGSQPGFSHQTLFVEGGSPKTWIGRGVRTVGDLISDTLVKAPSFYDSNNTSHYLNPAGVSNLNTINVSTINRNPVVTLSGDVSGSATMTNLGSINITAQ